jgi:hypothetical protein
MKYIITISIAAAFAFYWTQVRPANIRSECVASAPIEAEKLAQLNKDNPSHYLYYYDIQPGQYVIADRDALFTSCLANHGLK